MKKPSLYGMYGMPHDAVAGRVNARPPHTSTQEGAEDPASATLRTPPAEDLAELKRALAASQQQLQAAQQEIATLAEANARLRRRLVRLAEKCAQALHFAHYDALTGLPNRSLLLDRLKQAMAQSARQNKQVALLFIDLDRFKGVNDCLGHAAGDELLRQVAGRLAACVRCGDTACRYGGDEFVVMLPEIGGEAGAEAAAEKIRTRLAAPYGVDGHVIAISASIGVAVYQADGQTCSELIKQADSAMYLAKVRSNTPMRPFQPTLQS